MCLHNTFYHSMIFKTITDDLGNAKLSINTSLKNLFNRDFFKQRSILSDDDINALKAYNAEIERGISPMTAYYRTMQEASNSAVNMVRSAGDATVNIEAIGTTSKAATAATKALAVAGNMIAMWGISVVLSKVIEGIQYLASSTERYLESQQEIVDKTKEQIAEYDTEINSLTALQEKLEDAKGNKEKLAQIQNELNNAIGETPGLLNNEDSAWSVANQKITDRIALLKKLREEELQKNIQATKNIYNNQEVDNDWGSDKQLSEYFDYSNEEIRNAHKDGRTLKSFNTLKNEYLQQADSNGKSFAEFIADYMENEMEEGVFAHLPNAEEIQVYLDKQYSTIAPLFSEYISNLDTSLPKEALENILKELVYINPNDAEAVENQFKAFINALKNSGLEKAYNDYLTSLTNDNIDSEALYENLRNIIDTLSENYPVAQQILDIFFNSVGSNAANVGAAIADTAKQITSFADALSASENYADYLSKFKNLAESGGLSPDVLSSTEEYSDILKALGYSAEDAYKSLIKLFGKLDYSNMMSGLEDSIGKFINAQKELIENDGKISFSTAQELLSLYPELKDSLTAVAGGYNTTSEALQQYIDAQLTSYDIAYNTAVDAANAIINANGGVELSHDATVEAIINELKATAELIQTRQDSATSALKTAYANAMAARSSGDIEAEKNAWEVFTRLHNGEEYSNEVDSVNRIYRIIEELQNAENNRNNAREIENVLRDSIFNTSSSSSSPQTFDWIEIKIDRLNDALDKIKTKADNTYSSWTKRNTELANAISKTQEAIDLQSQAYSKYMQQADSVGLPDTWKKLVENGSLDIESIADETLKDKINEYQTWYEKAQECAKTQETLNAELNELKSQKFTNIKSAYDAVINRMQSAYDLLENQITLLSSSGDYNSLRDRQNSIISSLQSERNTLQNMLNASGIEEYTESGYNLVSQIDDLDSQISDAQNALKDIDNLQFDNLKESFDFDTSVLEHGIQTIQNKIDLLELKGQFANESYYNGMIEYTQKELDTLKNERTQLQSILNNTLYEQGTSEWNDMYSALMDIDGEIDSMTNNLVDFNNAIRDLNWEIFEYLEESISRITDETDYYVELLSKKHLFDENGQITNYGITSMALHAVAYDVNKQKAQDYYQEIQELQRQLVNGAGKDVLEQYNDMVKAHRNAVLAAEDEKQAILDLIEDGYNQQLEALQRLIDKKKEQLNAEKNLYDYQKNIKEKTDNIASLEKQKLAYEGDTSEEAMSKIQQIKVQLEEAKADLKETEYEQYLQDTETMLDQLSTDYEEWINARLDNSDVLLTEIVSTVAGKGDEINNTLNEAATEYGTIVSDTITSVFDAASPFTNALTGGLNGVSISIGGTTAAINSLVNKISGITGVSANNNLSGTTSGSSDKPSNSTANAYSNNKTAANTNTSGNKATSNSAASNAVKTGKALLDSILINKTDYYPKASLNIDTSLVDRLKYNNKDSSWSARALYWSKIFGGTYTGSASQNTKLLNYLKANGYAKGSKYIPYDQLALLGEEGNELQFDTSQGVLREVGQGDKIFTNEASQKLYDFANNPEAFIQKYSLNTLSKILPQPIPDIKLHNFDYSGRSRSSQNMNVGDININMELPGVENYEDFRNKLIKDNTFENAMFTSINHAITGKGTSLDKLKFIN